MRNGIRALAFAATAAAGLATGAGASEACPEFARAYVTYPVREPYQLARHHIAEDAQYRLMDSGQFRLQGAARCASPVIRASVGGHRSLILAPDYRPSMLGGAYHALINATAKALNLQADLLHAVIAVESAYDPKALSPKGAQGLMQLMPATARLYTVSNPYDPGQNVRAGARHLRYLLGEFDNDLALALAAYNAGAEAVRRYRNTIPPYPETRDYVRRVIQLYHRRLNSY